MSFLFPLDRHWRTGLGVSFLGTPESQDKKWVLLQMSWACGNSKAEGEPDQGEGQGPAVGCASQIPCSSARPLRAGPGCRL